MNIVVFGIGGLGTIFKRYCEDNEEYNVIAAIDNRCAIGETVEWMGINAVNPVNINQFDYDRIFITVYDRKTAKQMKLQLLSIGIAEERIFCIFESDNLFFKVNQLSYYEERDVRVNWVKAFAQFAKDEKLEGNVAECGVYKGDFSIYINKFFPDKIMYLFDTFEGFSECDVKIEQKMGNSAFLNSGFNQSGCFSSTTADLVLSRMPNKEKCVIRKGYFPESAAGLQDQEFCFVNLDMDLYNPQLEGLRFFYDRMVNKGVILLHDYYHPNLPGVKAAVDDFRRERGNDNIVLFPIGDECSIALMKRV